MTFRRSDLAHRLSTDPAGLKTLFDVPAVVWESPTQSGEAHWERTSLQATTPQAHVAEPLVFLVAKVPNKKNPFPMGVTVGRVDSNDIVIDATSVSRFHAWFQFDEKLGAWELHDADSKNGTFLNETRLASREKKPLASGDLARLGEVRLRFYLPEALFAWLGG